jgi:hypothetical protein
LEHFDNTTQDKDNPKIDLADEENSFNDIGHFKENTAKN